MSDRLNPTPHGHAAAEAISALQKAIRRGDAVLAAYFADQIQGAGYRKWAWRRILTTAAEDCAPGIAREIVALHYADGICTAGRKVATRIFWSAAILLLAKAAKCRDADHLTNLAIPAVAIEDAAALIADVREGGAREMPDFALDVHTQKGRMMGRTKAQFFADEFRALAPRVPGVFDDLID